MSDSETIRFYDDQTEAYKKVAKGFDNKRLTQWIAGLPTGANVLDLGCGPGQDSQQMALAGLKVTATDASIEMLGQAGLINGVTTRLASFGDLEDVDTYDGIWASFSLLHAPKAEFPGHLNAIHRALKPGGAFGIALKVGQGEERDSLNRFYAYYEVTELRGLLEAAGFTIAAIEEGQSKGMAGTHDPFVSVFTHA